MFHILKAILLGPLLTLLSSSRREVSTFREDYQPHRVVRLVELGEMALKGRLILLPLSREEDEVVELSTPANDRNVLDRLFQDDVNETMHLVRVRYPPNVQPVGV